MVSLDLEFTLGGMLKQKGSDIFDNQQEEILSQRKEYQRDDKRYRKRKICLKKIGETLSQTEGVWGQAFSDFVCEDVSEHGILKMEVFATLAAMIALSEGLFRQYAAEALGGVIPATELKEVMYQAVPYAGFGKVSPFFDETRAVLAEKSLEHMVQERVTTNRENRLEKACRCRRNFLAM